MQASIGAAGVAIVLFVWSRIGDTNGEQFSNALQAIAAIAVAYAAIFGLEAWKDQKKYELHVGLASDVMAHLFEFQERFAEARSPVGWIPAGVDIADSKALEKYQVEERTQKLSALSTEFNSLVQSIAKLYLCQAAFCDDEMKALRRRAGELQTSCHMFYTLDWTNSTPDMVKLNRDLHAKIWGNPDDDFGTVVVENCDRIRKACRKLTH
jgi:hypothetical protein